MREQEEYSVWDVIVGGLCAVILIALVVSLIIFTVLKCM